uniref:Calmodulin binding protein central domain-containing protein n=1 Tax=Hordeum vulgare subsp. vulgare TaxID=112509 RepID=A0A8I6X1I7_HORVV
MSFSAATKKNPYPSSRDPVYKLSGIAMKGDRHKLLERHGIKQVEDLLRLYSKNPEGLREIFGKISDHDWDKIINHARKCNQVAQIYSSSIQENNVPHEHEPFSKTNDSSYLKGPCSMQPSPTPQKQIDAQVHHQQIPSSYNGPSSCTSSENALQASSSMLAAQGITFIRTDQDVMPYGEVGGIQVTGQQGTCIGSEVLSASSMDNNTLDGSNSEQVGSLENSNIIPNGNRLPTGIDLSQWLDILQNQTYDDHAVTETTPWGVSDSALDSTVYEAGNILDSPFSEASISYVGHSPVNVSETGRGRSSLPLRGASSRSYRGHSSSPLRGAGTTSYRRHSASPLRVEGPRNYEGDNPSPVWGAGSTSYAS